MHIFEKSHCILNGFTKRSIIFFTIILQNSGVPLNGAGRIQINLELERIPEIEVMSKLPKMIFPLLWFQITVDLPEYLVNLLKYTLTL